MEKLVLFFLLIPGITMPAFGGVSTKVYLADTPLELADSNVPFVYRDIMVGTKLTIYIDSNVAEYWETGFLVLEEANMADIGNIYGRNFDGYEYPGSCLPDAGDWAAVWDDYMYPGPGFQIVGGEEPNVGDWFVFDYNSIDLNDCNVAFYDYDVSESTPKHVLSFHHVRTRDFDESTKVDYIDLSILISYWLATDCNEPNWCEGTDLNTDHKIDFKDYGLFCDFWLEETE